MNVVTSVSYWTFSLNIGRGKRLVVGTLVQMLLAIEMYEDFKGNE